ncbi:MAG: MarR family transcriptional regulator [Ponticaulis sp.]|nr:MarR family transcriptional regulator [Ponticaulis sp.]
MDPDLPITVTLDVRDTCLCMRTQRAARALARRFDDAFRHLDLTHGQFSVMMTLNQPSPPNLHRIASFLGMDRTSLTAKLKALVRKGWVTVTPDAADKRSRQLALTNAGRDILKTAYPIWQSTHHDIDVEMTASDEADFKGLLDVLAGIEG